MSTKDISAPEQGWTKGSGPRSSRARTLVALVAALLFAWAGISMLSLQTVNGNTVAELFDNYVGIFCLGMAALTLVIVAPARRD